MAAAVAGVAVCVVGAAAAWQWLPQAALSPAMPAPVPLAAALAPPGVMPGSANEQQALRELALLWGHTLSGPDACQAALARTLRCHQGKGGLYQLRLLDRPAVLTLRDGDKLSYVVLSAMDADTVSLTLGGKQHRLSVAALTARFDGSFTTFWSMPQTFRDHIPVGARGPDVDWIAAQLARPGQGAFDAPMQAALRRFQSTHHLTADGLVGPHTYMRLNRSAGVAEPRLLEAATGK
jgi:general secretion pathway protein A